MTFSISRCQWYWKHEDLENRKEGEPLEDLFSNLLDYDVNLLPVEYFKYMLTEDNLTHITVETNRFIGQCQEMEEGD